MKLLRICAMSICLLTGCGYVAHSDGASYRRAQFVGVEDRLKEDARLALFVESRELAAGLASALGAGLGYRSFRLEGLHSGGSVFTWWLAWHRGWLVMTNLGEPDGALRFVSVSNELSEALWSRASECAKDLGSLVHQPWSIDAHDSGVYYLTVWRSASTVESVCVHNALVISERYHAPALSSLRQLLRDTEAICSSPVAQVHSAVVQNVDRPSNRSTDEE